MTSERPSPSDAVMRAVRLTAAGQHEVVEVPTPRPAAGELLLAPVAVGLCATDLELLDGSMVYLRTGQASLPLTPGHEWAATVVEVGSEVTGFAPGELVVGECSVGCGVCKVCQVGNYHRCRDRRETGIMNLDGALAGLMVFPARAAHVVPTGVGPHDAALVEPTSVAFRAIQRSGAIEGDRVLVVGAGTLGCLTISLLQATLAADVAVLVRNEARLARAASLGAREVDPDERFTTVIEASGSESGVRAAHERLAPGGRLVLLGLTGLPSVALATDEVVVNDQEIVGSLGSPGVWPMVLALLATGRVRPSALVTHRFALDAFDAAIALTRQALPDAGKILILPSGADHG